jgi:hypothetical protein
MIVFDQPMELGSLEAAIEVSPGTLFAAMPMLEESFIVLLRPLEPLAENMTYNIAINQKAMSSAGMPLLESYEFSFKTKKAGPASNVIATIPEDGTIDDMAGQPITITFDQRMAPALVESAISVSPSFNYSTVWVDGDTTAILQSHAPLDINTVYSVTIDTNAMSSDGVPLEDEYQFSFTTGIMGLPRILGTMPNPGQANIPSNHPIEIVFDRSMDTASVEALLNVYPNFAYDTFWLEADMVLQVKPVAPLLASKKYTINIGAGALSSFGLPLENSYEFSFTTKN